MIIVDFARIYGKFEDAHIVTIKSICRFFNEEFLLSVSTILSIFILSNRAEC